jgi:hypothetical protein
MPPSDTTTTPTSTSTAIVPATPATPAAPTEYVAPALAPRPGRGILEIQNVQADQRDCPRAADQAAPTALETARAYDKQGREVPPLSVLFPSADHCAQPLSGTVARTEVQPGHYEVRYESRDLATGAVTVLARQYVHVMPNLRTVLRVVREGDRPVLRVLEGEATDMVRIGPLLVPRWSAYTGGAVLAVAVAAGATYAVLHRTPKKA